MDVLASMNGRRFQAPPAVGQPLLPTCAAEPSEDGEIFDSDDDADLPSVKQILAFPKRATEVIDLTCDDDGDSEGDDGNHTEVSCLSRGMQKGSPFLSQSEISPRGAPQSPMVLKRTASNVPPYQTKVCRCFSTQQPQQQARDLDILGIESASQPLYFELALIESSF